MRRLQPPDCRQTARRGNRATGAPGHSRFPADLQARAVSPACLIMLLMLAGCGGGETSATHTSRDLIAQAQEHLQENQFDDAIADFKAASGPNRPGADAYLGLGMAYQQRGQDGDAERALENFTEAIRRDPSNDQALRARGSAFLNRGMADLAIDDFSAAIQSGRQASDFADRGRAYLTTADVERSIKDCRQAIRLDPANPSAYTALGMAYAASGKYAAADNCFRETKRVDATKTDEALGSLCYLLATQLEALGRTTSARRALRKATQLAPQLGADLMLVARADAVTTFRPSLGPAESTLADQPSEQPSLALSVDEQQAQQHLAESIHAFHCGDWEQAVEDLSSAMALDADAPERHLRRQHTVRRLPLADPSDPDSEPAAAPQPRPSLVENEEPTAEAEQTASHIQLGKRAMQRRDWGEALDQFTTATQISPHSSQAFFERGRTFLEKRNSDNAISDFSKAIRQGRTDPQTYCLLGQARLMKGSLLGAIDDFTKALSLQPDYADAYLYRGTTYLRRHQPDAATLDFSETIQLRPNSSEAYRQRGMAHLESEQFDSAIEDFQKSMELEPSIEPAVKPQLKKAIAQRELAREAQTTSREAASKNRKRRSNGAGNLLRMPGTVLAHP